MKPWNTKYCRRGRVAIGIFLRSAFVLGWFALFSYQVVTAPDKALEALKEMPLVLLFFAVVIASIAAGIWLYGKAGCVIGWFIWKWEARKPRRALPLAKGSE